MSADFVTVDLETANSNTMNNDFTAIDLETANHNAFSICQIGVAGYRGGELSDEWMTYLDPESEFCAHNISIHGITAPEVRGWPKLPEVAERLRELLDGQVVISHGGMDPVALAKAFRRYRIPRLHCVWLDSAMVAQRAWAGFDQGGFGLQNLCQKLQYRYHSHDALGDAKAAAVVVMAAIEQTGLTLRQWLAQTKLPIADGPQRPISPLSPEFAAAHGNNSAAPSGNAAGPVNRVISPETLRLLTGGTLPG